MLTTAPRSVVYITDLNDPIQSHQNRRTSMDARDVRKRQNNDTLTLEEAKTKKQSDDTVCQFHHDESLPSPHVQSFDALRGIGVIIVILYHMGYERFSNAWFEISLFFAMSGFLITKTTVESYERNHHVDVLKFWAKRISRLFPALLLMLVVLVLSQKLPFRRNDGVQFQREANDLFYAALFLTNYNLVYKQPDDYFDDFSAPSITRHLWTLSIEEQYYIMWPLVVWLLAKIFDGTGKPNYSGAGHHHNLSYSTKTFLQSILAMDVGIIIFSYYSSLWSIENMGMTAAYYSTWCRMGDIAAGGSAYSFSRLVPMISSRWHREVEACNIQPLSTRQRVFLEAMIAMLLLTVVCAPMIPRPANELLEMYFHKLRLLISLLSLIPVFHTIQASEPLPKWAIASKIFQLRLLCFLGTFSYGVYLFHWPIIVLLGDPQTATDRSDDNNMITNALLVPLTILMGYLSFVYYEVPLMKVSKATKPWKTVVSGLLAVLATIAVIHITTFNLPAIVSFKNDMILEDKPVDERYTPVFFHDISYTWSVIFRRNVLDGKTRHPGKNFDTTIFEKIVKYYPKETKDASASVIISCTVRDIPCDHPDLWISNTYWIWLDSEFICGQPNKNEATLSRMCYNFVTVRQHTFSFEKYAVPTLDTDSAEFDEIVLLTLFFSIDDLTNGILNRRSVFNSRNRYEDLLQISDSQRHTMCKEIKLTVLGESVAEKIGIYWKDYIDYELPQANLTKASLCPKVTNLAYFAQSSIAHYLCLSPDESRGRQFCSEPSIVSRTVLGSFQDTKPNAVVIHDQTWAFTSAKENHIGLPSLFDKILAFNMMISDALHNEVASIYYMTKSPHRGVLGVGLDRNYATELKLFQQMTDTLACQNRNVGNHRICVVLVDWARLICPNISEEGTVCERTVHGFEDILTGNIHPMGESDMAMIESDNNMTWDEAMEIPVKHHHLQLAPSDNQPPLHDLITAYTLCPNLNISQVKVDVDTIQKT
ncbi:hypothetical protein ACHAW6_014009 [Cyclotella cf. meneghiniana]